MRSLIIHNPNSGFGSDAIFEFERMLIGPGDECCMRLLRSDEPADEALADAEDFDVCVLSGGDGTVSGMLHSLAYRDVTACVFPSGTANLLYSNIGNAFEPAALARACKAGKTALLDLGEISWCDDHGVERTRGFSLISGIGYDAQLMRAAIPNKKAMGQAAYFAAVLADPNATLATFEITIDGERFTYEGISCLVADTAMLQGDIELIPDCRLDDGLLDSIALETKSLGDLARPFLAGLFDRTGKTLGRPTITQRRGSEIKVVSSEPLPLEIDGDAVDGLVSGYTARVLKSAIRVIVDATRPYYPKDATA